jgi:hypothetical protein
MLCCTENIKLQIFVINRIRVSKITGKGQEYGATNTVGN